MPQIRGPAEGRADVAAVGRRRGPVAARLALVISGAHVILYSTDAEADRAFFRDVLEWPSVDAGAGWLIFRLPPAEVAVHPTDGPESHEVFLMCDDVEDTVARLAARGVDVTEPVTDAGWGLLTRLRLPGGGTVGLYQPRHPRATEL